MENVVTEAEGYSRTPTPPTAPKSAQTSRHTPKPHSQSGPTVVATLDDGTRVIECEDGIQWVIQSPRGDGRWRSNYFCRTKEGLLLYAGSCPELLALPDRFPETRDG